MAEPIVDEEAADHRHRVDVPEVARLGDEVLPWFRLLGVAGRAVTARAEPDRQDNGHGCGGRPRRHHTTAPGVHKPSPRHLASMNATATRRERLGRYDSSRGRHRL